MNGTETQKENEIVVHFDEGDGEWFYAFADGTSATLEGCRNWREAERRVREMYPDYTVTVS